MEIKEILLLFGFLVSFAGALIGMTFKIIGVINDKTDSIKAENRECALKKDNSVNAIYDRINITHGMTVKNSADIVGLSKGMTALELAQERDRQDLKDCAKTWAADIKSLKSPN